jgi:predicted N-acetyltransferase YhbS
MVAMRPLNAASGRMKPHIRTATPEDAQSISQLVQSSFRTHVAADWELEAQDSFYSETSADKLAARIAESTFAAVYAKDDEVIGVILLPRPNLIQLCFVATDHLRQGIAGVLWQAARDYLEENFPEVKTVELNASPYAVEAYSAMGFFPISKQYKRRGSVATRMACWLPNRDLASAKREA